jgi:hypothetical protein
MSDWADEEAQGIVQAWYDVTEACPHEREGCSGCIAVLKRLIANALRETEDRAMATISCAFCGKEGHDGAQCPDPIDEAVDGWTTWKKALRDARHTTTVSVLPAQVPIPLIQLDLEIAEDPRYQPGDKNIIGPGSHDRPCPCPIHNDTPICSDCGLIHKPDIPCYTRGILDQRTEEKPPPLLDWWDELRDDNATD